MRKLPVVLAAMIITTSAFAATKPSEISSVIRAPQPYGNGAYTVLFVTAYNASLWTDATTWSMQSPFALSLSYNMAFSHQDVIARSLKEMKSVDPRVSDETLAHYGAIMSGIFPDVKAGDEITGLYQPGRSLRFFYNGRPTGEVHDPSFAKAFFGIWLSPQTSDPKLRKQLLRA